MPAIHTAATLQDAELVLHALREAGIAGRVLRESLGGLVGELPVQDARAVVWIDDPAREGEARRLIAEYEDRQRASAGPDRTCAECGETSPGNFELCWSCRAPFALDVT